MFSSQCLALVQVRCLNTAFQQPHTGKQCTRIESRPAEAPKDTFGVPCTQFYHAAPVLSSNLQLRFLDKKEMDARSKELRAADIAGIPQARNSLSSLC